MKPHPLFDSDWYLLQYPDVAAAGINPLQHYMQHGWREGRDPNPLFDTSFYLEKNPDVAQAGVNPLTHYSRDGWREGRSPHPEFDISWYLDRNSDIREAGVEPLAHYLANGIHEGRRRHPDIEADPVAEDPASVPEQADIIDPSKPQSPASLLNHYHTKFSNKGPEFEELDPTILDGRKADVKLLAFYLPQFHTIAENDKFWGKGFTEWRQIPRGLPRFPDHYQPRIPRDLGFYDLTDINVMSRQIDMAKTSGIYGFGFYYYWFNGQRVLQKPIEQFLGAQHLSMPFFIIWANENWTKTWDGMTSNVLLYQDYRPEDERALLADIAKHFRDGRYINIDGRPLFVIYKPSDVPDPKVTFERWREIWRTEFGVNPLIFMAQTFGYNDPLPFGLDGALEFPPHKLTQHLHGRSTPDAFDPSFGGRVIRYDDLAQTSLAEAAPPYPLIKTIVPSWDNDARRPMRGLTLEYCSPKKYEAWLAQLIVQTEKNNVFGERFVAINAWNEWAEGAYLEPDVHFGAAYLNATSRALRPTVSKHSARPRIVIVSHDAFPSGAQLLALHLSDVLRSEFRFDVDMICLGDGALLDRFSQAATLHLIDKKDIDSTEARALIATLRTKGADIAIVNTTVSGAIVPAMKQAGFTVISLIHELPGILKSYALGSAAAAIAAHADQIVFPAEIVRTGFESFTGQKLPNARVCPQGLYLRNPYRSEEARKEIRADIRRELGLPADAKIVICVGHADHRKGVDLFVDIISDLAVRSPSIYGLWVGDHEAGIMARQHARIAEAGFSARFRFIGRVDDPQRYYTAADVYALTSREDPFPSVVMEAFDAGIPIVAFKGVGGFEDLVERGGGFLVPAFDTGRFADAVTEFLNDTDRSHAAGAQGQAITTHELNFRHYAFDLLSLAGKPLPRVSVVVPNYNYARYLRERLDSIAAQTLPIFELIVLDDASTDNSAAVIETFLSAGTIPHVFVRNERNSGSAFAQWLRGVEIARGDLIWIAEADDLAEPEFLAEAVSAFDTPGTAISYTESRQIDEHGQILSEHYLDYVADIDASKWTQPYRNDGRDEIASALFIKNTIPNVSGAVFRRDALLAAMTENRDEILSYRNAGDWVTYLRVLEKGSLAFSPRALNTHRRHQGSVTIGNFNLRQLQEIVRVQRDTIRRGNLGTEATKRADDYAQRLYEQFGLTSHERPLFLDHPDLGE